MKALILALLLLTSCKTTMTSPITQIEYTGEISEDGISATLKPPFWTWAVELYKSFSE
jgi:hypothetical protein